MKKLLVVIGLTALATGCASTSTNAIMGGAPPATTEANWTLVGPVNGKGSAMTVSPGIGRMFGAMSTIEKAKEDAVGAAIFNNDQVDMLVAPKTKISYMSFLGLFDTASAEVKGQGVKLR